MSRHETLRDSAATRCNDLRTPHPGDPPRRTKVLLLQPFESKIFLSDYGNSSEARTDDELKLNMAGVTATRRTWCSMSACLPKSDPGVARNAAWSAARSSRLTISD